MRTTRSLLAGGITVAVLALTGLTASASAQGPVLIPCAQHPLACITPLIAYDPCLADPTVPTCVNDAIDMVESTVEAGRSIYNNQVQPLANSGACQAYTILTGKPCPKIVPNLG